MVKLAFGRRTIGIINGGTRGFAVAEGVRGQRLPFNRGQGSFWPNCARSRNQFSSGGQERLHRRMRLTRPPAVYFFDALKRFELQRNESGKIAPSDKPLRALGLIGICRTIRERPCSFRRT